MDADKYQTECAVTLSGSYHGQKVTMAHLRQTAETVIKAGEALDKIKKALFYGKGDDLGLTRSPGARNALEAPFLLAGVPIPLLAADLTDEEKREVERAEIILHMVIGKVTEAAEAFEAVMKVINGDVKPLDAVNLLEEVGDGLWYDGNLLTALGSSFPQVMATNNGKLRKRFPQGFTEHDANNRDLEGERAILEASPAVGNDELESINGRLA